MFSIKLIDFIEGIGVIWKYKNKKESQTGYICVELSSLHLLTFYPLHTHHDTSDIQFSTYIPPLKPSSTTKPLKLIQKPRKLDKLSRFKHRKYKLKQFNTR